MTHEKIINMLAQRIVNSEKITTMQGAVEYVLQYVDEHPQSPWHDAKKELPKRANGPFLTKDEKDKIVMATDGCQSYIAYISWTGKWTNFYTHAVIVAQIIYWMPIPETPKGGER